MTLLPEGAYEAIFAEHERDHQEAGASREGCNGCAMLAYASGLRTNLADLKRQDEVHWKTRRALLAQLAACRDAIHWALGEHERDEFTARPEGAGPYYWRKELRRRAGSALAEGE